MTHRHCIACVLLSLLLVAFGLTAAAREYVAYHDCSNGRITAVTISNISAQETEYVLSIYDEDGRVISETAETLRGFESVVRFVNELVPGEAWGLVRVETDLHLTLGVWLGVGETWRAVENVTVPHLDGSDSPYTAYWFTANYAHTLSRSTGIDLLNPNAFAVEGTLWLYDAQGTARATTDFTLEPYEAAFFHPESGLEPGESMWGVADIVSSAPVLLIAEYVDANGELIDIDLINRSYYVQ